MTVQGFTDQGSTTADMSLQEYCFTLKNGCFPN